jgi:DNA-binding NarL/FixJ family response regulator
MTRILIADDHPVVLTGLRAIIASHLTWEVVAEASDGQVAVDRALATKPDIAIIDDIMPVLNGLDATQQIRSLVPTAEVLILTTTEDNELTLKFFYAGARAVLPKQAAQESILAAIGSLERHTPYLSNFMSEHLLNDFIQQQELEAAEDALTSRERAVIQLVAEGHSSKMAARILNVSYKTIESHRMHIMDKLGVTTIAGVVRYAIRNRIIQA